MTSKYDQLNRLCGAFTTRTGLPCNRAPVPGRRRCRFHGGCSTGPKTEAGKASALAAMRAGLDQWRKDEQALLVKGAPLKLRRMLDELLPYYGGMPRDWAVMSAHDREAALLIDEIALAQCYLTEPFEAEPSADPAEARFWQPIDTCNDTREIRAFRLAWARYVVNALPEHPLTHIATLPQGRMVKLAKMRKRRR